MIRLGVNIDHCATLKSVRGYSTPYPDILECARLAVKGGADLITIHLREDRRHIQDHDVFELCKWRAKPINLELAPSKDMLKVALRARPDWICFVPERRRELTTEGGLDLFKTERFFRAIRPILQKKKIRMSAFIDAEESQVRKAQELGFEAVEFHTGHWVTSKGAQRARLWTQLRKCAVLGGKLGLQIHAGHGLDYRSTRILKKLPHLEEVNIGHFIVCESLIYGLEEAVRRMKSVLNSKKV